MVNGPDSKLGAPKLEPLISQKQRQAFIDRGSELLPPVELIDSSTEQDEFLGTEAEYRVGGLIVTIYGYLSIDAEAYDVVHVTTSEALPEPRSDIYYATKRRSYEFGSDPVIYEDEYKEVVTVWERRGIRLDGILRAGVLYSDRREELLRIINETQYSKKGPAALHYDEVMEILAQCGPDNFVPPPDPNSVYLI